MNNLLSIASRIDLHVRPSPFMSGYIQKDERSLIGRRIQNRIGEREMVTIRNQVATDLNRSMIDVS